VNNTWDGLNRLIKVSYPDSTYVTNAYDKLDLVKTIDRMGLTNRFEYNAFRQVIRSIDPLNRTNTFSYCGCGTLDSTTDPMGNTTSYVYDYQGHRVYTYGADGYNS